MNIWLENDQVVVSYPQRVGQFYYLARGTDQRIQVEQTDKALYDTSPICVLFEKDLSLQI